MPPKKRQKEPESTQQGAKTETGDEYWPAMPLPYFPTPEPFLKQTGAKYSIIAFSSIMVFIAANRMLATGPIERTRNEMMIRVYAVGVPLTAALTTAYLMHKFL